MRGHFTKRLVIYLSAILLTFCAGVLSAQLLTGKQPAVSQAEAEATAALGHYFPAYVSPPVDPKNVIDYYRLLPDKYFEANEEQRVNWMLDERRGAIVDLEHGYLHALGDGAQTDIYVRLFDRPGQLPVLAVKYYAGDSQDYTYLDFFEYRDGGLVQVSLSPVTLNENLEYELPRYGNTIQVFNAHGAPLYNFVWSQTGFLLRRR